jgi:hypothetical protein
MAADGMIGNGSKVAYSNASPTSWQKVGQLLNLDGLEFSRGKVDRTVHSASMYKRNLPGMAEVSDLTLEILADPDEAQTHGTLQNALRNLCIAGTNVYWRVEVPVQRDLATTEYKPYEFRGWVQRFKHATPREEGQVFNVSVCFDSDSFDILATGATAIS